MTTRHIKALFARKRVDEAGRNIYTFQATTAATDRHGEIVTADGWETDNYVRNPVILDSHSYGTVRAILGKSIETRADGKGLEIDVICAPSPEGKIADEMIDGGFINAVSVGFASLERKPGSKGEPLKHTRKELLEVSLVPVPANHEALRLRGLTKDERDELRTRGVPRGAVARSADFDATLDINERLMALWRMRWKISEALDTANGGVLTDENLSAEGKIAAIATNLDQWKAAMLGWYRDAVTLQEEATEAGLEVHLREPDAGHAQATALAGPSDGKAGRKLSKATIAQLRELAGSFGGGVERLIKMCDEVESASADDEDEESDDPPGGATKGGGAGAPADDGNGAPDNLEGLDSLADALKAFVGQA